MKINLAHLKDLPAWQAAHVEIPNFDVAAMQAAGQASPRWLHIGPGNIFRVFPARIAHDLLSDGEHWPITAVVPLSPSEKDVQLQAHDLLTLGVTLNVDGSRRLQVIAGMSECLATQRQADFQRFLEVIKQPEVSILSFTITEKGYAIHNLDGSLQNLVSAAMQSDPYAYQPHTMALVAGALLHRFQAGGAPITLISMDNFSHNGDKLRDSVLTVARGWEQAHAVPTEFLTWLQDESKVAFPISCIDKITPRPSESVATDLKALGFDDMEIQTPERTPLAGFVNTEAPEYLIIEDKFAGPRPPFEKYGAQVVSRQVCDDFERMKVTTCLNPLHTALAVAGCLLRMPTIDAEMRDPSLKTLVNKLAWDEGLPVVVDPGIIKPADFLTEVLEDRFPNPYLPDDPARIAMDTSQKLPIRFGQTIKAYQASGRDLAELTVIPLVFALWCRYLLAVDDFGQPFVPSSDPLLEELQSYLTEVKIGEISPELAHQTLQPILSNANIFGVDLYTTPLAQKVENLFIRLSAAPGAVRATIDEEMSK